MMTSATHQLHPSALEQVLLRALEALHSRIERGIHQRSTRPACYHRAIAEHADRRANALAAGNLGVMPR